MTDVDIVATTTSASRLCAGLIFEVSTKTKDEAENNEAALMHAYNKYKEVNEEGWNELRINLITLTHDNADDAPESDTFHRLYVFYPKTFEIPCDTDVLESSSSSSPDTVSLKWVELSKGRIDEDAKKRGVEILTELWDVFRKHLSLEEQKTMPLNVIGINENAPLHQSSASSGSCGDAMQICDGAPDESGATQTSSASNEI